MNRAIEFDFSTTRFFSANEWPAGALAQMSESIIKTIVNLRESLPPSHTFTPSPLLSAHIRKNTSSRHSVDNGRLSDATDFFVRWRHIWDVWLNAMQMPEIGGLGIYLDTQINNVSTPMLHIDNREKRVIWARYGGIYHYYHKSPADFFSILAKTKK